MKNLLNLNLPKLLISIAISFSFSACDKAVQEVIPEPDEFIGTWTATEATTIITYQGMSAYDYWVSQGATPEEATYQVGYQTRGHGDYIPFSIEFKEDGTYNSLSGAVGDVTGSPNDGTWELSDDRKTIIFDGFEVPVLTLSKSTFSIQLLFDSNEYSMDAEMTYDVTINYTK